jgi:hypothetical protein
LWLFTELIYYVVVIVLLWGVCILCCNSDVPVWGLYIMLLFWCSYVGFVCYAVVLVFLSRIYVLCCWSGVS